jgi:ABC-type branched-subunit amino acid transport system permease subunit/ABC-type branched-subunit amino acid transport system ATPase component
MHLSAGTVVDGLVLGLNNGLLAMGLVLVYRTSRVVNFAHGQLGVVSAVLLVKLVHDLGFPYGPSLVFVLALAAVIGGTSELVLRRLFDRPRFLVMVATIGLSQLLFLITLLPFVRPKHVYTAFPLPIHTSVVLGGTNGYHVVASQILTLIVAPLAAVALAVFFARSPHGLAMRAMSDNLDAARLSGVWVRRTSTLAWVLAGLLSGVTAILAAPARGSALTEAVGPTLLLRALTAALIGAMASLPVAFVAGVALGLIEQVVTFNFHSTATTEAVMFALLLAVLLARAAVLGGRARRVTAREVWPSSAGRFHPPDMLVRRQVGQVGVVVLVLAAIVLPPVLTNGGAFLLSRLFVYAIIAVSLTVLAGWAGQLSLGQFALVAVGAVVTARWSGTVPLLLLLPLAGAISAVVAVLVGLPALRIRGLYLAVSTLGFALLMQDAVLRTPCWRAPVVGWHVCSGLPDPSSTLLQRPKLFGLSLDAKGTLYEFVLALLLITLVVARWWRDRGVARVLVAVRDNETAAAAMGTRVVRAKLAAFALSGFLAGVAGVAFALVTARFSATSFDASQSILVVSMVVIGGLGSLTGAVLGAAYLIGLPAVFGSSPTVQFVTSGLGLTAFILYLPGGLAEVAHRLADQLTAVIVGPSEPEPETPERPPPLVADAPRSPAQLDLLKVGHSFGGVEALDDVVLAVAPGELVALLGPNGSGKTTLLDVISGQLLPTRGQVLVDGIDVVDHRPEDRAALGVVRSFQDCRLFPELSVEDTLLVAEDARLPVGLAAATLQPPSVRRRELVKRRRVDGLIVAFHLEPFRHIPIGHLSTGTRRVVDLACIAGANPRLLLLDEPTAGIAQREAEAFVPLLQRLHAVTGATIVLVEHDVALAVALAQRLVVMVAGRTVSAGPVATVLGDPAAIEAYLGASAEALARSGQPAGTLAGQGDVGSSIPPTTAGRS